MIEAYGTGIPKIMRSYADCNNKPELQTTNNAFKITLPNKNVLYNGMSDNEEKIIALLDRQKEIVRKDVETALSVSQAMAVRLLRGLLDKGAIQIIGSGKNTRYKNYNSVP